MSLTTRLYAIALVTVAAVVACDRVPLTSPSGATISISIDKEILPLNGQATVRAIVIESSGTPVQNGTMVVFQPSIGRTDPVEAQTVNGVAVTTFLAGSISGAGVVHAFSGGIRTGSGNSSGNGGAAVRIGAAAAASISASATPPSVSQSGGTVTIAATVFDSGNNPLPGVNVTFSSTTGTLSQTTALTDSNGIARVQLSTTSTATVTASAGSATPRDVVVTVSTAPTVDLTVPTSGTVGVPVPMSIAPPSGTGANTRQLASVRVDFGDGTGQTFTNITGTTGFTHTYDRANGYTVTATSTDVSGNTGLTSRAIVINRATPSVTITPSDTTPQVNQQIGFTISSTAGTGGPPIESVAAFINGERVFSGSGSSGAFLHTFTATGTYLIEATATDSAGNVGRTQTFLTVTP